MKFVILSLFFLSAGACCRADRDFLRSSATQRLLSYEFIHTYQPLSLVTDQAAIDKDLHEIKVQLATATNRSYQIAEDIYRRGAYSKSAAILTLDDPLTKYLGKGAKLFGVSQYDGTQVAGILAETATIGNTTLKVKYSVIQIQENYVNCQVGANPTPNLQGCFADSGSVALPSSKLNLGYSYNVTTQNVNLRTIAGFSRHARKKLWECENCPSETFKQYAKYFGSFDYADHIITQAFRAESTNFPNASNMDFSLFGKPGRTEVIQKAMAYMSIWMHVVGQMEEAIYRCFAGCDDMPCGEDEGVHAWDEAVAFYTGSRDALPGVQGNLLFNIAEKRCRDFSTCGTKGGQITGTSKVNLHVFRLLSDGQQKLREKDCEGARDAKDKILRHMKVPLIQGTLHYAHIISRENYNEKHNAEGAIYALATLPLIHACDKDDAATVYENMKPQTSHWVDFRAVKRAIENNYKCMNIKCSDVGGIYSQTKGRYEIYGKPCGNAGSNLDEKKKELGKGLGYSIVGLAVVAAFVMIASRISEKSIEAAARGKVEGAGTSSREIS